MMTEDIRRIAFGPEHIEGALRLSQANNWPHSHDDWAMLLQHSRGSVALAGEHVIGTALVASFGDLATVNMIIVDADHQGKGLGRALMTDVVPLGGTCRLVATSEGLPLYERLGFTATGQVLQHQGVVTAEPAVSDGVRPANPDDLPAVAALETDEFGGDRSALIDWLMSNADVFVQEDASGQVSGFAARRVFGRGHVIGPVVAQDKAAAHALIAQALQGMSGAFVRIDTDAASGLSDWFEEFGLAHAGGGVSMFKGEARPAPMRFALFSQALG